MSKVSKKGPPHPPQKHASEHQEQVALFNWARLAAGRHPELALLFAIPNGGARSAVTGAMLKAEGVKAGVPDVCLPVARGRWHGLWIELKAKDGTFKGHQKTFCTALAEEGYRVAVCWGWGPARDLILSYLNGGERQTNNHPQ